MKANVTCGEEEEGNQRIGCIGKSHCKISLNAPFVLIMLLAEMKASITQHKDSQMLPSVKMQKENDGEPKRSKWKTSEYKTIEVPENRNMSPGQTLYGRQ